MNTPFQGRKLRIANYVTAVAGILLLPTLRIIRAEVSSSAIRSHLPKELRLLERAFEELPQHRTLCAKGQGTLTPEETSSLLASAASSACDVTAAFTNYSIMAQFNQWSPSDGFEHWVPFSSGLSAAYRASDSAKAATLDMCRKSDAYEAFCERSAKAVYDNDDSNELNASIIREEEQRNQAWLNEQVPKLKDLHKNLLEAQKVFDRYSPRLTALAWFLGIFEAIGMSLLFFVVLPRSLRLYRQRRAATSEAAGKERGA